MFIHFDSLAILTSLITSNIVQKVRVYVSLFIYLVSFSIQQPKKKKKKKKKEEEEEGRKRTESAVRIHQVRTSFEGYR